MQITRKRQKRKQVRTVIPSGIEEIISKVKRYKMRCKNKYADSYVSSDYDMEELKKNKHTLIGKVKGKLTFKNSYDKIIINKKGVVACNACSSFRQDVF